MHAGCDIEADMMEYIKENESPLRHKNAFQLLCKQAISLFLYKQNRMYKCPKLLNDNQSIFPLCDMIKESNEIALFDAGSDYPLKSFYLWCF